MDSSSSELSEENQFFKNNSLDSGFSEDMKTSPDNTQCSSRVNQVESKNNLDKILQWPIERDMKRRKMEEAVPGSSGACTSQEYLDKMSILHKLRMKEKYMKIAIAYEKLRKVQPVILDTDILHKRIAESQTVLKEARHEHKMKNLMCTNLQLANTFQRIAGKTKAVDKHHRISEIKRECIKDLVKRNKELARRIRIKRKELAKIDEEILELKKGKKIIANKQIESKPMTSGISYASSEMDKLAEVQRIRENNDKVTERVQLLSSIIQSLIPQIGSKWQNESKLAELMAECEKVSKSQFDKVDEINALLKSMAMVKL